jgi:hypothetical protein
MNTNKIKIYILTLAGVLTILGQLLLLLVPDIRYYSLNILVFAYILWCIAFFLYIQNIENNNSFHMRLSAVFVLLLFYLCQVLWIIYNYNFIDKKDKKSKEYEDPKYLVEKTSLGAALAASIMFVLSTIYPNFSFKSCYGLIGSLSLLSAAIISLFKSINQHMTVAIGMILILIQAWINNIY